MAFNIKNIDFKNIDFKDKKTQTTTLIILLSATVFILYIYYVFLPRVTNDVVVIGKTIGMRTDLKEAKSLIAQKDILRKKVGEYNEKIELYEKKLPAQQEIPSLLEDLSKMARNANITIIGITPITMKLQKEKKISVYQEIPILITAKSGYHELGRFLNNLENGDRFMKIVDISIKANSAMPKRHDVELMVYTYVLPAE
ncbi:MAG: type 4a pilus biogenesis protein PilO [Candidatus Omnitrophota bacterium]|nr:type 4a pilus biogenesis protein PilO [Candidatus Omnitrophota bacterium]